MKLTPVLSLAAAACAAETTVVDYGKGRQHTIHLCNENEYNATKFEGCHIAENCVVGRYEAHLPCSQVMTHEVELDLSRRDSTYSTFEIGNNGRTFGTTNPCTMWHDSLFNRCNNGGCESDNPYDNDSQFNDDGSWVDSYIPITGYGFASTWDQRNVMVNSINSMASHGQTWWQVTVSKPADPCFAEYPGDQCEEAYSMWQGYGADWYEVTMFQYQGGPVLATMSAYADPPAYTDGGETANTLCSSILPAAATALGAINADAGGLLGVIGDVFCS